MRREQVARCSLGYDSPLEKNWGGNLIFGGRCVEPLTIEELQSYVRLGIAPVRVVGRGHSFSPMVECAGGTLISMSNLNKVVSFHEPTSTSTGHITVEGGITFTEIINFLGGRGALRNLPSCPQFTVAGAIATGTHGSGIHIQNLASSIAMMEFVIGDGSLIRFDRNESMDLLEGSRVHLGCLGVVSHLTLDVVSYFDVATYRYDDAPLDKVIDILPSLWQSCDSLSVWASGFGIGHGTGNCWMTFRHFIPHWDHAHSVPIHSSPGLGVLLKRSIPRYCADDGSMFTPTGKGPWYDSLSLTIDQGKETSMKIVDLQAEFFVPIEHAQSALHAVWSISKASKWTFSSPWGYQGEKNKGLIDAMEFRQVKGDDALMTPHPTDSLGIHISFNGDPSRRDEALCAIPILERALEPFSPRAHWGKLSELTTQHQRVQALYGDKLQKFCALREKHDPEGKFLNKHLQSVLYGENGINV